MLMFVCVLGRAPGTVIYRDIKQHKGAVTVPGIVIFRFDGSIFFGNTAFLREQLLLAEKNSCKDTALYAIVLDCSAITAIDYSGVLAMKEIIEYYRDRKVSMFTCHTYKYLSNDVIVLTLANLDNNALRTFQVCGLIKLIGTDHFFWRVHDAVLALQSHRVAVHMPPLGPPPRMYHNI